MLLLPNHHNLHTQKRLLDQASRCLHISRMASYRSVVARSEVTSHKSTPLAHSIPCLHVSRMARAARTIRKRIPVQSKAPHTHTETVPVPPKAPQESRTQICSPEVIFSLPM